MRDYIGRGTFREISLEEQKTWRGPVNYIAHHGVSKPSSKTTKVRIVSNSSLSNNNSGVSYNNMLPKGPNSLVPLIEALITWRVYPRVVMWDYSKCYNRMKMTEKELHCRDLSGDLTRTSPGRCMVSMLCTLEISVQP